MTNIYARDVSHIKTLDPYRLQELYQMHPCAEHVVKKLLVAGERSGGKTMDRDIQDCLDTLTRWQAMRAEDARLDRVETTALDSPEPTFELIEKPPRYAWSEAPSWANWAATDENGYFFWYEEEPFIHGVGWDIRGESKYQCVKLLNHCADWRLSLEARPQ